jgi:hypothetical protein
VGKRGDKRRAKQCQKRERSEMTAVLTLGPMTVTRTSGGDIASALDLHHPQYEAFRTAADALRANLPGRIEQLYTQLGELTAKVDAYDLLAYLHLAFARNPEAAAAQVAAFEVAASVVVDRSARRPTDAQPGFDLRAAMDALEELQTLRIFLVYDQTSASEDQLADVRANASAFRTGVRGPSYPWQERTTLHDLFAHPVVEASLRKELGLSIEDILSVEHAIEELGAHRLNARRAAARNAEKETLNAVERVRSGKSARNLKMQGIAEHLASLPQADATKRVQELCLMWMGHELGDTMSFTATDIATTTGLGETACERMLSLLALPFEKSQTASLNVERFREQPLLVDDQRRYFCVSVHLLLWGLRPALERVLKGMGGKAFSTFEKHRTRRVEERAMVALSKALRPDSFATGLHYEIEEDGETKRPELDGLLRVDNALILVEAKASSMRAGHRRLAPSIAEWLRKEVGGGARQARRARQALASATPAPLSDEHNQPVEFDLQDVRRAFEIVVVLEDLPAIGPATWQLARDGVLPSEPIPWVVSLHELETICDLIEWPVQLIHYLMRRRRLDEQRHLWAVEELDFFMYYLTDGLFWEIEEPPAHPGLLASQTDPLDEYLLSKHRQGRRRVRRPSRRLHRDVRALLSALDGLIAPGRLDAQLVLLEFDGKIATRIASGVQQARRNAAREHRLRDMTFITEEFGVTVMGSPPEQRNALGRELMSYCHLKKHQHKMDAWVGFGGWAGAAGTGPARGSTRPALDP